MPVTGVDAIADGAPIPTAATTKPATPRDVMRLNTESSLSKSVFRRSRVRRRPKRHYMRIGASGFFFYSAVSQEGAAAQQKPAIVLITRRPRTDVIISVKANRRLSLY